MSGSYRSANDKILERTINSLQKPERPKNIDIIASKLQEKPPKTKIQDPQLQGERTPKLYREIQLTARNLDRNIIQSDFTTGGRSMLQYSQQTLFTHRRTSEDEYHLSRPKSPGTMSMEMQQIRQAMTQQSFSPEHQSDYEDNSQKRRRYEDEASELEDLEQFAKDFKQKRIKMGFTQGDVGIAMGKFYGNDFSQTTISRFEALNLSVKNMCKLKPLLERWLVDVDRAISTGDREGRMALTQPLMPIPPQQCPPRKRKKRTSIPTEGKSRLEDAFVKNPKPTSEEICKFSEDLKMDREVVRVWFCNRRQKQKRIATQQQHYLGDDEHSPTSHSAEGESSPVSSGDESYATHHPRSFPLRENNIAKVSSGLSQTVAGIPLNQHPPRPGIIRMMPEGFSTYNHPQNYSTHSNLAMGGNATS